MFKSQSIIHPSVSPEEARELVRELEPTPAQRRAEKAERRRAANRANARKSTGPKSREGKRRSSRNALKHGLCAATVRLPGESQAAYDTFAAGIGRELAPATPIQRMLAGLITHLLWRMQRLGEAEKALFEKAASSCELDYGRLTPAELLALCFAESGHHSNPFTLLARYERTMRNDLLRLMREYWRYKEEHPAVPAEAEKRSATDEHRCTQMKEQAARPADKAHHPAAAPAVARNGGQCPPYP